MLARGATILLADLVMSLDNVIAVAAAAKGSTRAAGHRPGDQSFRWSSSAARC